MASPVLRDKFCYHNDTFSVRVGSHNHPRCDSNTLYGLLIDLPKPLLSDSGTAAQPPPLRMDTPSHFYEAQCMHYGLHPYKTKSAAKKHLLAAFDGTAKELKVPSHILEVERALKEEYRIAQDALKKTRQEEKPREEKTKRSKEKQTRRSHKKVRGKKGKVADTMMKQFADAGIVIAKVLVPDDPSVSDEQLRKEIAALSVTELRKVVEKLIFSSEQPPAFKKAFIKELALSKEPIAHSKGKAKGKTVLLQDTFDGRGEYMIVAPYLRRRDTGADILTLEMSASPGKSHHWASFDFGLVSGVMRSCGPLSRGVGDTTEYHWRQRKTQATETLPSGENVANITFLGNGRIQGKMFYRGTGTFEFIGMKVKDAIRSSIVSDWKNIYYGTNQRSRNASSAAWARWGDELPDMDYTRECRSPTSDTASEDECLFESESEDEEDSEGRESSTDDEDNSESEDDGSDDDCGDDDADSQDDGSEEDKIVDSE